MRTFKGNFREEYYYGREQTGGCVRLVEGSHCTGAGGISQGEGMVLVCVVMIATCSYTVPQSLQSVHFRRVNFTICKGCIDANVSTDF